MLQLVRLAGSILLEGITSAFQLIAFLLVRGRKERATMHRLILGCHPDRLVALFAGWILGAFLLLPGGGCAAREESLKSNPDVASARVASRSHPGTSFQKQLDEFTDSVEVLWRMDDAQQSLEDDLRTFGDPEWGELFSTFAMFGW